MSKPIRFRVTFELMKPNESVSYNVCSLNGENKAVVLATQKYSVSGKGHIYSVAVEPLSGNTPEASDLIDRMEW